MNKIVKWLQEEQVKLQKEFERKITKKKGNKWDDRGVWIAINCVCGHKFSTAYFINNNGKCRVCKRKFYRKDK